jgi:uncharacterized DUF497 family protein
MAIVFDPAKSQRNLRERGLSFERAKDFDFATALLEVDDREDYGEVRINALGFLDGELHSLTFTERDGDTRVISFRKAGRSEMRHYDEVQG